MMQITEEMVRAKEQQNATRRAAINKLRSRVSSAAEPDPNFPPECCCIKPLIYHNIREQVPVTQHRFMYILAGLYISLIVLILYNVAVATACFILGGSAMHFGLSFLYLLGLPGAWITWYYNVYCAVVYSSRPRQLVALLGLLLAVGFDAWMAVGVKGFGGCGWLYALSTTGNVVPFVLLLISSICWTLHGVLMFIMFARYWRVSGALLKNSVEIYRQGII